MGSKPMKEPDSTPRESGITVDRVLFWATILIILAWGVPLLAFPDASAAAIESVYNWIAYEIGVLYQWAVAAAIIVLAVIALGKYGHYRLGGEDAERAYPTFSWVSMLFCAGIGGGLVYWAPIEWAFYVDTPPFGLAPESPQALEWAATYGIFHWGVFGLGLVRVRHHRHRVSLLPTEDALPQALDFPDRFVRPRRG